MPDYEMFAPTDADMTAAFQALNMTQGDGFRGAVLYSRVYYKVKKVWDGTSMVTDQYGTSIKKMDPLPGVYAIVRWTPASLAQNPFPPNGVTLPAGVTIKFMPADSPIKFG